MTHPAIRISGIGKKYRIGSRQRYRTLRDTITDSFKAPFRRGGAPGESEATRELWALKDVSLEIGQGEVVGIIGGNGAGKSTLLKVLSRITEPTTGFAEVRGRVGSLLEVGTGFHPELTGRENIFLNGAILGMRRAEIEKNFDAIVEFAEIDRFIDTPVKHYSSGMYMRLAFSVAAHLTVELLFVDEVLAVGDANFQRKCLGKMGESSRSGRTVVFVSHNMAAMRSLCDKVFWLSGGQLLMEGNAGTVIAKYLANRTATGLQREWPAPAPPGQGYLRQVRLAVDNEDHIDTNTTLNFHFEYLNLVEGAVLNYSFHLINQDGVCIFSTFCPPHPTPLGLFQAECTVPGGFLNDGQYRVQLLVVRDVTTVIKIEDEAIVFEIHDAPRQVQWYGKWAGVVRPVLPWSVSFSPAQAQVLETEAVGL